MTDFERAFRDFSSSGGRAALEQRLAEIDTAAKAAIQSGEEPDQRLMALREGLQRLLAALDDLGQTGAAGS